MPVSKQTVATFQRAKAEGRKLAMLTAYDYSTAKLQDEAGVDGILIGDSLGNVILGYEDTLEGGREVCPQVRAIVAAGIPVMGHLGLTPQSVNAFGGFKVQGKTEESARALLDNACALEEAGAFAIVLECVPAALAELVTSRVSIPTIGIGAGAACDGQILVYQDMLGMTSGFSPKFARRFAEVGDVMSKGFSDYIEAVGAGTFPADSETFHSGDDIIKKLY